MNVNAYNYGRLNYSIQKNNIKYMEKLYTTNNVVESLNSRINFYLPKGINSIIKFVNSISKFIINEEY